MTTATRNEAAERTRERLGVFYRDEETLYAAAMRDVDEALAVERRATVKRIRAALKGRGFSPISEADMEWISWRLDEEAAR